MQHGDGNYSGPDAWSGVECADMASTTEEKVKRPVTHLATIARRYPSLWKWMDRLRANRDKIKTLHNWPDWCYLPWQAAGGLVTMDGPAREPIYEKIEACRVAALGSWRVAKEVYVFDETVFEELWETPMEGNIPIDVLHRLPTWCAYVPFPAPRAVEDGTAYGFFVHLNCSDDEGPILMMAIDFGLVDHMALAPYTLHLREGSDLLRCLTHMHERLPADYRPPERLEQYLGSEECERAVQPSAMKQVMEPLLSLTVYLCSTSAEIREQDPLRGLRRQSCTKKTKKGVRTFVPEEPRVWEVAYRIGATLRAAATSIIGHGSSDNGDTHTSPRPHMRRAHWHSFWTGPKAAVGKPEVPARELIVKWIPPIPVAMGPDDEIVPTVHRVTR